MSAPCAIESQSVPRAVALPTVVAPESVVVARDFKKTSVVE